MIPTVRVLISSFFFQAEDGIRDLLVTGVQTCALPIYPASVTAWIISVGTISLGSYTTIASPTFKLCTCTPSSRVSAFVTCPTQCPQLIPVIFRVNSSMANLLSEWVSRVSHSRDAHPSSLQTEEGANYYSCLSIQLGWRGYEARTRPCGRYREIGLFAGAIQAAVCTADPAGLFQAGAQGLTGSVQTNREIVVRDLQLLCDACRRFILEIDSPDELGIVRTQLWKQTVKAGTDGGLYLVDWRLLIVPGESQLLEKGFIAASFRAFRPIIVDECVADDFMEPGHHTVIISYGMVALNGSDEALLQ